MSWRRLANLIRQTAADPASNLHRQLAGDLAEWTLPTQLAAVTANTVRVLAWQQTEDAQGKHPKHYPEPIQPPKPESEAERPRITGKQLAAFRDRTRYERT